MPLFLTEQEVTKLLTMEDTLAAADAVFKAQAAGERGGVAGDERRRRELRRVQRTARVEILCGDSQQDAILRQPLQRRIGRNARVH